MRPTKINKGRLGAPKVALIGCGAIAEEIYLPALTRQRSIVKDLILVDSNPARAKAFAAAFGIENIANDYRQVVGEVDGVIVALPTHLHHPISMEFLSRGIHVLCEKPLAECAEKARDMVGQAQETGAILAVNYLQRLYASFAKVKQLIQQKTLGEVLSIQYLVGEEFKWPSLSGFYFNGPISSRGILRDRGAHVIDHICWWLGGKPTLISCENDSHGGSEATTRLRFKHNRCVGEVRLSWLCSIRSQVVIEFEEGSIAGDVYDFGSLRMKDSSGRERHMSLDSGAKSKAAAANTLVSRFIGALTTGEQPAVSGADVLPSIEFVDECYAAATRFDAPWYAVLGANDVS